MFVQRSFGPSKPAVNRGASDAQGVPIENYFAPEDGVADKITARLAQAKQSIHFLASRSQRLNRQRDAYAPRPA